MARLRGHRTTCSSAGVLQTLLAASRAPQHSLQSRPDHVPNDRRIRARATLPVRQRGQVQRDSEYRRLAIRAFMHHPAEWTLDRLVYFRRAWFWKPSAFSRRAASCRTACWPSRSSQRSGCAWTGPTGGTGPVASLYPGLFIATMVPFVVLQYETRESVTVELLAVLIVFVLLALDPELAKRLRIGRRRHRRWTPPISRSRTRAWRGRRPASRSETPRTVGKAVRAGPADDLGRVREPVPAARRVGRERRGLAEVAERTVGCVSVDQLASLAKIEAGPVQGAGDHASRNIPARLTASPWLRVVTALTRGRARTG